MQMYKEEISVKGKPIYADAVRIDNKAVVIEGNFIKVARCEDEWYEDIEDPEAIIGTLKQMKYAPDIFTFLQRLPDNKPRYKYYQEWESIAALPIKNFDHWWKVQISPKTRNLVRKAEKSGILVKKVDFNADFIRGMTEIFNETPIRQGKSFWHYGKDLETVKQQFSKNLSREDLFGAYFNDELIGFIFLAYAGTYASLGQIISKISARDKAPNNALIAKAVEICADKGIPFLVYAAWNTGSLGDFKRHNGFEKVDLPRYYCPLTQKGWITLKLNLHHGVTGIIPENIKELLIGVRKKWFTRKNDLLGKMSGKPIV